MLDESHMLQYHAIAVVWPLDFHMRRGGRLNERFYQRNAALSYHQPFRMENVEGYLARRSDIREPGGRLYNLLQPAQFQKSMDLNTRKLE